jgi:hypothetical protein
MYLKQLRIMADEAAKLGHVSDATRYSQLANQVATAFNNHFYNASAKIYEVRSAIKSAAV